MTFPQQINKNISIEGKTDTGHYRVVYTSDEGRKGTTFFDPKGNNKTIVKDMGGLLHMHTIMAVAKWLKDNHLI